VDHLEHCAGNAVIVFDEVQKVLPGTLEVRIKSPFPHLLAPLPCWSYLKCSIVRDLSVVQMLSVVVAGVDACSGAQRDDQPHHAPARGLGLPVTHLIQQRCGRWGWCQQREGCTEVASGVHGVDDQRRSALHEQEPYCCDWWRYNQQGYAPLCDSATAVWDSTKCSVTVPRYSKQRVIVRLWSPRLLPVLSCRCATRVHPKAERAHKSGDHSPQHRERHLHLHL
jgi:hypothetical protein